VCDTGLQNVIRPKQNTANVDSENWKWTWLQIFSSPSPSPSSAKMDLSPDSSTTTLVWSVTASHVNINHHWETALLRPPIRVRGTSYRHISVWCSPLTLLDVILKHFYFTRPFYHDIVRRPCCAPALTLP